MFCSSSKPDGDSSCHDATRPNKSVRPPEALAQIESSSFACRLAGRLLDREGYRFLSSPDLWRMGRRRDVLNKRRTLNVQGLRPSPLSQRVNENDSSLEIRSGGWLGSR